MRSKKIDEHIIFGKEILLNQFKKENIEFTENAVYNILNEFNCKKIDQLYEQIGSGSITSSAVLKKIFPELKFTYRKTSKFQ